MCRRFAAALDAHAGACSRPQDLSPGRARRRGRRRRGARHGAGGGAAALAPFGRGNPRVSLMVARRALPRRAADGRRQARALHGRVARRPRARGRLRHGRAAARRTTASRSSDVHARGQRVERRRASRAWCCATRSQREPRIDALAARGARGRATRASAALVVEPLGQAARRPCSPSRTRPAAGGSRRRWTSASTALALAERRLSDSTRGTRPQPMRMAVARTKHDRLDRACRAAATGGQRGACHATSSAPSAPEQARRAHRRAEPRAPARLDLSEPERRLLSDLFAIVSEHAADSAVEIDRARVQDAFVFACEHHAAQRRKSGEDFIVHPVGVARICAGMRLDTETLCAALLHDTVEDTAGFDRGGARALRRGDRADRRRRDEADGDHLPVPRRGAGGELPQDDGGDGHGRAGHPDQARRSPAQHAHDRGDAQAEADREGARDARHLRAAGPSPGNPRDQVGARGPRVRDAAPAQVPGDQGAGRPAARRARGLRQPRPASTCRGSSPSSASRRRSPGVPSTSTRSTRR